MNKLENTFANRSYVHDSLIRDKRSNEQIIAETVCKLRTETHIKDYLRGKLDQLIYENWKIKMRTKIEMGVD